MRCFNRSIDKIVQFVGMTVEDIIHFEDPKTPARVKLEAKTAIEKVQLISKFDDTINTLSIVSLKGC